MPDPAATAERPTPRVLVVTADAVVRTRHRRALERGGFSVTEMATGVDSIAAVDDRPDVVVLDVDLPDVDGLEVCRRMRAHAHGRHLAILQISSATIDPQAQVSALEGGADVFLVEPVDTGVLVATTRALLRLRAAEEAARDASTRLGMAQEAARSGVWTYDVTGGSLWWSREANDVMGLPRDAQPQFDESIGYIDARDRETVTAELMEALAEGDRWDREYRIATPRSQAWIHAIGRIDRDIAGNATRMAGIILDVTERRRSEDRLRRLQRATVEMAAAVRREDVIVVGMAAARDLVDADAAAYGLADDSGMLRAGVLDPTTMSPTHVRTVELSRSLPGPASMADRRSLRCPTLAERLAAFPASAGLDTGAPYEAGAWAPILTKDEALGFVSVHHRAPTELTPDDMALLEAVAQLCSQALVRARLYEREATARDAAERAAERLALLADVTEALEQEHDFAARLQRLLETLVPRVADFATVEALRADGRLELLALHHVEPEKVEPLRRLREQHALDADAPIGLGHVIRTGRSLLLGDIPDQLADDVEDTGRRLLGEIATRSFLAVPLATREGTIGALMLCTSVSGRTYGERDRQLADELADRIALVLENARLFDEQRRIARTLQLGLLGGAGTGHRDITLALRYQPGTGSAEIGGDWYDAFDRDDGTLVIAVGDVVGRGLKAATTMAKLRNALRAFALVRDGPGEILHELDRFAQTVEGGVMTTVACAVVDPVTGHCRIAAAGHPPPILVHPDGRADAVMGGRSMPLVGEEGTRPEIALELPAGTTLALYSDGVIERRRESIDEGIGRLAQLAGDRFQRPVGVMADELLEAMLTDEVDDDAALLLLRREGTASPVMFRRVSADPSSLGPLRASLRSWFARARIDDADARDLLLACGEACNNAVEHAYTAMGSGEMCIEARLIGNEAHISVRDFGHWRPAAVAGDRGRGSLLMSALCDSVEVMRMRTGTMVTLRRRVSARVPA